MILLGVSLGDHFVSFEYCVNLKVSEKYWKIVVAYQYTQFSNDISHPVSDHENVYSANFVLDGDVNDIIVALVRLRVSNWYQNSCSRNSLED